MLYYTLLQHQSLSLSWQIQVESVRRVNEGPCRKKLTHFSISLFSGIHQPLMISVPQSHSKSSGIGQVVESAPVSLLGMGSSVLICNREKAIFTRKCYRKETVFSFIPKSMQANNKVVIFSSKQMNPAYSSDLVPTIMDWHGVALPSYKIFKKIISYTGRSLLQFPLPSNFLAITVTSH